jgi:hypothetical protein
MAVLGYAIRNMESFGVGTNAPSNPEPLNSTHQCRCKRKFGTSDRGGHHSVVVVAVLVKCALAVAEFSGCAHGMRVGYSVLDTSTRS